MGTTNSNPPKSLSHRMVLAMTFVYLLKVYTCQYIYIHCHKIAIGTTCVCGVLLEATHKEDNPLPNMVLASYVIPHLCGQ